MVISPPSLPRLGLGMAALGRPGYINLDRSIILGTERTIEMMQSQANMVMDQLFDNSSTSLPWLDCARSYGLSERFVGEYLKSRMIPPNEVYVSSKWGYSKFVGCYLQEILWTYLRLAHSFMWLTRVCLSLCCRLECRTCRGSAT